MPQRKGKRVEFKAGDTIATGHLVVPETSHGGVLVLHAWWGLNDFFKSFSERLATEGYTVLAPDLHQGKVARTIEEAKDLMAKIDEEKVFPDIILGALEHLRSQPHLKQSPVGVIGFSMGASWALWLSAQRPSDVKAIVVYYGAYISPKWDFSKSRGSFLGHFSPEDEWEPIEGVRQVEEKLRAAGRPVEFHTYPGAKHWFIEENRPEYDPSNAVLAWNRTVDFLGTNLR